MFTLIRQDPAFRTLPKWLVFSAVTAAFLVNVITFQLWRQRETADPILVLSVVWLAATVFLVFGEVRTRCSPFVITLPIPTRKVWLSHLSAVILSGVAVIAATAVPVAAGIWLLWKLSGRWMVPVEGMGGTAIHLIAGLILAVMLLQSPVPAQHRVPRNAGRVVLSVFVMGAVMALAMALDAVSPWTAVITLALAVAVGLYRLRAVPEVFSLSVTDAPAGEYGREAVRRQWEAIDGGKRVGGWSFARLLDFSIWRCFLVGIKVKQSPWLTYPFLLLFGAFLAGLDERWIGDSLRFNYVWMTAYVLMAFSMYPPKQIYLVDGLPVSRRRILNVMTTPLLVVVIAGYGTGLALLHYLDSARPRPLEVIHLIQDREDGNYYLYVPYSALRISWNGRVPEVTAPWGETHKVWSRRPFLGTPVAIYSPYSTPPGSSIDFVAWQMSRAVEQVYGATIPPGELERRYLKKRSDGGAALIPKKLDLAADYPNLRRVRKAGPVFPVVVGLSFVLWMLSLTVYFQTFRAGTSNVRRTATAFGLLALLMLGWLGAFVEPLVRVLGAGYFNAGFTVALRQAGRSTGASAAVWLVMIALSSSAYAVALRRFEKVESVQERKTTAALGA
jgi:hypothetical protein